MLIVNVCFVFCRRGRRGGVAVAASDAARRRLAETLKRGAKLGVRVSDVAVLPGAQRLRGRASTAPLLKAAIFALLAIVAAIGTAAARAAFLTSNSSTTVAGQQRWHKHTSHQLVSILYYSRKYSV